MSKVKTLEELAKVCEERALVLAAIEYVDFVFLIKKVFKFGDMVSVFTHREILKKLMPTALIANPLVDKYWKGGERRAKEIGVKFIPVRKKGRTSSSKIIQILEKEL